MQAGQYLRNQTAKDKSEHLETTDYAKIIRGLKARRWLILASAALVTAAAIFGSLHQKPTYQASSVLMMRQKDMTASMLFGSLLGSYGAGPEQSLATQAKLITTRPMLVEVVDRLKLKVKPDELAQQVIVTTDLKSNMLSVDVKAGTAYQAQLIANTLADVYLEKTKSSSVDELAKASENVHLKLKNTEDEIIALAKETAKYQQVVPDDLKAKLDMAARLYAMLAEKDEQLNIYKELKTSDAQLVAPAVAPEFPISPKPARNAALGLMAGLVVGVFLALGLEELDDKLKTVEDVESSFSLPVIGKIPFVPELAKSTNAVVVRGGDTSPAAEAFRTVRTNLEYFSAGKPINALMITSANPREGKSLFAVNLAAAFAQTGMKVLLVSCDLRLPGVHEHLGVGNEQGLSAYLGGHTGEINEIIKQTPIKGLSVIASGPKPPNPAELLGSEKMIQLVKALREHADLLIFDTPPLLSVADANVVSRYSDGVAIVCDYTQTTIEDAKQLVAALGHTDVRQLGVIMNKIPIAETGAYSQYNYYQGKTHKQPKEKDKTLA